MYVNILLIALIMVIITDLSGVIEYVKSHLYYRLRGTYNYPPSWDSPIIHLISCSLCQTWWMGLLYLLITHQLTIPAIAFLLVVAYLTTVIRDILIFIKDLLVKAINKLNEFIN